jgi:CRISPR-associated protein Csy1
MMENFSALIEAYIREKQKKKELEFCAASWLDSASKRASQISAATHVLKYTHSDAKGTNVYAKIGGDHSRRYVSTDALDKVQEDVVGNAAAMDVAGLLFLEVNGIALLHLISNGDSSPLAPFAESDTQLSSWMNGFKSVLTDRELSSHTLAKQIYFPVEEGKYHLLAPLFASSLSQALYDRVKEDRFGEKAKEVRECKKKDRYSDAAVVDYPNLAIQQFGGTKPQNISRLNSIRGGKAYLLRSVPPIWRSIKKPPMKKDDFWKSYKKRAELVLNEFKRYLIAVQNRNTKDIRDQRQGYVDQLLDLLIQTSEEVQVMECGWSKTSEIPLHEQLWLDPLCKDQDFQEKRNKEPWKESISGSFATLIVRKLEFNNLKFSDIEYIKLRGQCLEILKAVEQCNLC